MGAVLPPPPSLLFSFINTITPLFEIYNRLYRALRYACVSCTGCKLACSKEILHTLLLHPPASYPRPNTADKEGMRERATALRPFSRITAAALSAVEILFPLEGRVNITVELSRMIVP